MGVQWKYLWPVLVLAAALTLGLGAALRFLRPASLGERIGVAEGASLRQVVVERSDGGGHGSHESSEPALLAELSSLLADTRLRYDGLTDGGVPVSPPPIPSRSIPPRQRRGAPSAWTARGASTRTTGAIPPPQNRWKS